MLNREKRLVVLSVLLLLSVGWFLFDYTRPYWSSVAISPRNKVLPGNNEVLSAKVLDVNFYTARIELEYFYNGSNGPTARIRVESLLSHKLSH